MGASTELFPPAPLALKVTMVPSGIGFPEQSRTGSVSTCIPLAVRCPFMRKLQGSEATCCSARVADTEPIVATTCTLPADLPELVRNHATPFWLGTARDKSCELPAVSWKFTVTGLSTRL